MKAGRSTDGIVYPDVGQQISDLVSNQPGEAESPAVKSLVPRKRVDEYSPVVSTGYSRLDPLLRKDLPPLSSFGYLPRPAAWQASAGIFQDHQMSSHLKELSFHLSSETKLQELADDLVADAQDTPMQIQHFLAPHFPGIVFPADAKSADDPLKYVQERSLYSLDDLRQKLFDPRSNSAEKSSALLQFRAKLEGLKVLSEWIQNTFSDLDYLELSRVKAPLLC
jgi:hypothetical protein